MKLVCWLNLCQSLAALAPFFVDTQNLCILKRLSSANLRSSDVRQDPTCQDIANRTRSSVTFGVLIFLFLVLVSGWIFQLSHNLGAQGVFFFI